MALLLLIDFLNQDVPNIIPSMLILLLGNLLLLSLTRPGHEKAKAWVIFTYFAIIMAPVLVLASFLKGPLHGLSNKLFELLQPLFNFLLELLTIVLKAILVLTNMAPQRPGAVDSGNPPNQANEQLPLSEGNTGDGFISELLLYVLLVVLLVGLLIMAVLLLRIIWQRLRLTNIPQEYGLPRLKIKPFLQELWLKIKLLLTFFVPGKYGVTQAYQHFLKWADRRNHTKGAWETPYELVSGSARYSPTMTNLSRESQKAMCFTAIVIRNFLPKKF
ncbi:hypothetical protein N752_29030 [Desulforamulus aquiferis]|nr:hypothetical protein [Desulforamulus aquiferis]RYD01623.1 hypothetical protein N752_29030 [Desulforamulus aquiferis]